MAEGCEEGGRGSGSSIALKKMVLQKKDRKIANILTN